jgi:hypothetical protein
MRVLLPLAVLATIGACSLYFNTSEQSDNRHGHPPGVDAGECGGFSDANPPCIPDAAWYFDAGSGYGVDGGGYGVDAGFGVDGGSGGCNHDDAGGVDAKP